MSQSLAQIYVHLVFCTKGRVRFLRDERIRIDVHNYLGGACKNQNCPVIQVGGVEDHVHILCRLGRTICVADLIRELKIESSQWVKTKDAWLADFHWQSGYGAFSLSPSHVDSVVAYIANQEMHHRQISFQEEFRSLLTEYGLEWDERYVWD